MIKIKLNGKEIEVTKGKTILEVANEHNIEIPTLCHDEELKPYGSCWVCAVQIKGKNGFVTACGTEIYDGMEVITNSEEVLSARKMALELLLSDHYADCEAPCKVACPANVDVQSYVSLIANGQYHEAVKVIKETLPMPLSIGRVCPAFCEEECRRELVEEPIAIRQLKRHTADIDLNDEWSYVPKKKEAKDKKIAIIGAGPSGLSCGFYLSNEGYEVKVFEASPHAGGWLRYGIPEYRLPKKILDKEIELMCANGMQVETNKELGKDFSLSDLSENYDAVYMALGAQKAVPMRLKGADIEGAFLGVDFLKKHALGEKQNVGKKVAIVGGGNTAIDCARTARRMGAEVTIAYRRSRKEMPAEDYEIVAAEEEGVELMLLTNPAELIQEDGKLKKIKFAKMELGEPDSSGRRRPVPTGEYFVKEYDSVIAAISQKPDVDFLIEEENKISGKEIPLTRWSTADVDENTMYTGIENIFAGGDFRRGPATAVEAIADAKVAADIIDKYLKGEKIEREAQQFDSKKAEKIEDVSKEEYEQFEEIPKIKMPELDAEKRITNFKEVELGFNDIDAKKEAERCLECGCQVNETCALREYATDHKVDVNLFIGGENKHPIDKSHPYILRDANKCINCGRCVRTCSEIQGAGVLGYIYRGFTSLVAPEFGDSLTNTSCESCGKCIAVCPVGALVERNQNYKLNPRIAREIEQNCGNCGTGCFINVKTETDLVKLIETPEEEGFNKRNLCFRGRFGWQVLEDESRITNPQLKTEKGWEKISYAKAAKIIKEKMKSAASKQFYLSPDVSNEEISVIKKAAERAKAKLSSLSLKNDFTDNYIFNEYKLKSLSELDDTENIVIVGKISHTLRTICRLKQRKGKKLYLINNLENDFNAFADKLYQGNNLDELLDKFNSEIKPKTKTIFIYSRNHVSEKIIKKVWKSALQVCDFKAGSGVIPTSEWNNLVGLLRKQIQPGQKESADFTMLYGETPDTDELIKIKKSGFIVKFDTHKADAEVADLLLPLPTYLEMKGTAFADDGKLKEFNNPKNRPYLHELLNILADLNLVENDEKDPYFWYKKDISFNLNPQSSIDREALLSKISKLEKLNDKPLSLHSTKLKKMIELYQTRND